IVHGDLKSGNILVSADGNALICDFGLATILTGDQSAHTFSSFVKGTCRWMAPELFEHDQAKHTRASDVWAFGCVILELSTGSRPYTYYPNDQQVIVAVARHVRPYSCACGLRNTMPLLLWSSMQACWDTHPDRRPDTTALLRWIRSTH
ncbi:kinase-like protein, partial [Exidia glandulosa HHB12029]